MNKLVIILLISIIPSNGMAQENSSSGTTFLFKGQLSNWAHLNTNNPYPLYLGGRYLPEINYEIHRPKSRLIDFEASANVYGSVGLHFFDSATFDGKIDIYRAWARYSTPQLELRLGLQNIDFGTATMLRALRWFDQVDPRDPLQITEGVFGGLGRYYFLNNMNLWLWVLYGNENLKGIEVVKTNANIPEYGGRFQFPVPRGEAGISYHNRVADSSYLDSLIQSDDYIPENRIGLDAKWDLIVGLWLEAAWVHKQKDMGYFTNQEALTLGTDYTFGVGSGLHVSFEHMLIAYDQDAFHFDQTTNLSALSIRYPIGMFDNINAIFYYDWRNKSLYNFINWFRQFDHTTLYVMGYWNPKDNLLINNDFTENLYGGIGIQLMFVFNH